MFFNNLKFAFRSLVKNKIYSFITIAGLAVSLSAFILMALYINDEVSFDKFNKNASRIYRLADDKQTPDVTMHNATSAAPVAPALLKEFPQIEAAARIIPAECLVSTGNKSFQERKMFYADESLLKIFSFPMLSGTSTQVLKEAGRIVLTKNLALKYFGTVDATGKTLLVNGKNMSVDGVMENIPSASHLQFDFLISMGTIKLEGTGYEWLFENWYSDQFYTYLLLPENYDSQILSGQLKSFDKRHRSANDNTIHNYELEKLSDIYLKSDRLNQAGKTGNLNNLYIFSAIALFIIVIACINFINLSTARSAERAKEVSVKKVNGASRFQMAMQFFTESFLMTFIASLIAIVLVYLTIPAFNSFSGKEIHSIFTLNNFFVLAAIIIAITLLSGIYPAFILSAFKPVVAIKGKVSDSLSNLFVRKGLVVFQFAISVILLICSIVVYRQLNFMQKANLGFTANQTLVIDYEGDDRVNEKYQALRKELLAIPGIKQVTASSTVPGNGGIGGWSMDFIKKSGDTVSTELPQYIVDFNYMAQYKIPIIAGRGFSTEYSADSVESMLINEAALKKLGFNSAEEAIGVKVKTYPESARIIGIFKDFHFESLQKNIEPLAMRVMTSRFQMLSVELATADVTKTLSSINMLWQRMFPQRPMEYSFLDDTFNRQYQSEIKFGQVFTLFTFLAMLIACVGLFGVALFNVQRRTKEIGIRKVLGASIINITYSLSSGFVKLVATAIVIAIPVAWLMMNNWLQHFAYRTPVEWWIFIIAGVIGIGTAILTISIHTIKAALANPIKSLRTE